MQAHARLCGYIDHILGKVGHIRLQAVVPWLCAYQFLGPILHGVKHIPDTVALLQALLMALELISEVLDNKPLQLLCFLVASCTVTAAVSTMVQARLDRADATLDKATTCSLL